MQLFGFIIDTGTCSDVVIAVMAEDHENPLDIVKDRWKKIYGEELKDCDIEICPLDYNNFVYWHRSFD